MQHVPHSCYYLLTLGTDASAVDERLVQLRVCACNPSRYTGSCEMFRPVRRAAEPVCCSTNWTAAHQSSYTLTGCCRRSALQACATASPSVRLFCSTSAYGPALRFFLNLIGSLLSFGNILLALYYFKASHNMNKNAKPVLKKLLVNEDNI